jgi:hypothetical protein
MRRDQPVPDVGVDGLRAETHIDPPADMTSRHRVEALTDTHPGLRVDPRGQQQRRVERLDWQ